MKRKSKLTKDEFEQRYAERSGITVAELYALGRYALPCDCGEPGCEGWQMAHDAAKEVQGKKTIIEFLQSLGCEFKIVPYEPEIVTCLDCGAHFPENESCPGCHAERN